MELSINKILGECISRLTYPFKRELRLLIVVFLSSSLVECIGFLAYEGVLKAIFIAMHHAVVAYLIVLCDGLLQNKPQKIYRIVIGVLLFINLFIDLVCVFSFHFTFDQEVPAIILGTNSSEAIEFIQVFLPIKFWIVLMAIICGIYMINKCLVYFKLSISTISSYVCFVCVILFFAVTIAFHSQNWGNVSITKIVAFSKVSRPIELESYQYTPSIFSLGYTGPKYVVIIIGESFAKHHSSLYGYALNTNPRLAQLEKEGNLYVYDNVKSPALNTIPVFKTMMSTYKLEYAENINWYECVTLPMIMQAANYHTCWFSNQSQKGYHDNVIAQYASLCDTTYFNGNRFAAMGKSDLDGDLINVVRDYVENNLMEYQFHVIHLMGSHPDFKRRYPVDFQEFECCDYPDALPKQRENLSSYDNSVFYNDYVVSQLMNVYKDKEAMVIYFSDHGLDVYDSRDDYVGHARDNDSKSSKVGYNIPYMIYLTPILKSNMPKLCEQVEQEKGESFCINNMIPKIMNFIGISFESGEQEN